MVHFKWASILPLEYSGIPILKTDSPLGCPVLTLTIGF
jgi:hypothetical protein